MGTLTFNVNEADFKQQVLDSEIPVLVDFWEDSCPPCRMIAPIIDEIALEYAGRLRVAKLDTDTNPNAIMQFGVMGIPTLILFKGGEAVARVTGFRPKENIMRELLPHIS